MINKDTKITLGWLAGIIDGEGCIGLYNIRPKSPIIRPMICIVNTNEKLINEVKSILDFYSIIYYAYKYQNKNKAWKPSYRVNIQSKQDCKKLLDLVGDYLVIKKEQSNIVLEFINRKDYNYSEKILFLPNLIKDLNKKGQYAFSNSI